jgi:hypothetical protein
MPEPIADVYLTDKEKRKQKNNGGNGAAVTIDNALPPSTPSPKFP